MTGSAALAICYVAAGRFDAWLEAFIGKWDFSAAAIMVPEASGKVTDFCGRKDFFGRAPYHSDQRTAASVVPATGR